MNLARRAAGSVVGLGRIALALGLLAALWFGTVNGVKKASKASDDRRESDRSAVASAFASSIAEWVDAGRGEVASLARLVGATSGTGAQDAINGYLASAKTFTRDALVLEGDVVTAASSDHAVLVGLQPRPCTRVDEAGRSASDTRIQELAASARSSSEPVVSGILEVPGRCEPAIAIAQSSGSSVTVAIGDIEDAEARLSAGSLITDRDTTSSGGSSSDGSIPAGGTRLYLITGDTALEPRLGVVTPPERVTEFAGRSEKDGPRHDRYPLGEEGGVDVLGAYAPVTAGWSVVLEQDAAVFDIELQNSPSLIVASVLTVVFAVVFALLAFFDIRRRRAQRRAEIAKNTFFSIAGHELRTPLTSLKGFAELLSTQWEGLDDDKRRLLAQRIAPQTRRLDRLVERLLVAASIQAETHTRPDVAPMDPLPVVQRVADQFRAEAPLHAFVVAAAPGVDFHVVADGRALDQVMQHLVENAVKYSPSGGRVTITVGASRRGVEIAVEDEGVGLPSDHRRIFEKFVQGESVTKRVHDEGGVGLGLYIVRTLLEQMGGSVRAEQGTSGARFVVTLRPAKGAIVASEAVSGTPVQTGTD